MCLKNISYLYFNSEYKGKLLFWFQVFFFHLIALFSFYLFLSLPTIKDLQSVVLRPDQEAFLVLALTDPELRFCAGLSTSSWQLQGQRTFTPLRSWGDSLWTHSPWGLGTPDAAKPKLQFWSIKLATDICGRDSLISFSLKNVIPIWVFLFWAICPF